MPHALHELVEVQNQTVLSGPLLYDTLIKSVNFEGITGRVRFYDASADPDRLYDGDRRVGFSYALRNYVDLLSQFVVTGSWSPCATKSCGFAERWQALPNVSIVYSTYDNTQPSQLAPQAISAVRIGVLLPMFLTAANHYHLVNPSTRRAVFQALAEINVPDAQSNRMAITSRV